MSIFCHSAEAPPDIPVGALDAHAEFHDVVVAEVQVGLDRLATRESVGGDDGQYILFHASRGCPEVVVSWLIGPVLF